MLRFLVGLLAVAALGLAACGSTDEGGGDTQTSSAKPSESAHTKPAKLLCERASKALVASLESSLTHGGGLKRASVAQVDDASDAPLPGFRRGAYAVAGKFTGAGMDGTVGVWAVSRDMVRTGGGLAIGADTLTREFSDLGAAAAIGSPAADYAAEVASSEAGQEARRCAEGG